MALGQSAPFDILPTFELGKTMEQLRYGVDNPYGFTYVMAEEVTEIEAQMEKIAKEIEESKQESKG